MEKEPTLQQIIIQIGSSPIKEEEVLQEEEWSKEEWDEEGNLVADKKKLKDKKVKTHQRYRIIKQTGMDGLNLTEQKMFTYEELPSAVKKKWDALVNAIKEM
jgi:hypothetical protein